MIDYAKCCQWIQDEPRGCETVFCGQPVVAIGKSFCWEHHFRAYRKSFIPRAQDAEEVNNDGQAD
jgi:hypothetical protein